MPRTNIQPPCTRNQCRERETLRCRLCPDVRQKPCHLDVNLSRYPTVSRVLQRAPPQTRRVVKSIFGPKTGTKDLQHWEAESQNNRAPAQIWTELRETSRI